MTNFEPVDLWPVRWSCDVSTFSATATGLAVRLSTDVLWALTGRQFGYTTVTLRPTVWSPHPTPFPDAWLAWPGMMMPPLGAINYGGPWWGWTSDLGPCSTLNEVHLPAPVNQVTQVKVDGVVITGWRVDDNRILTRTDGSPWPYTNDIRFDDTAVGTWSVTATFGQAVPSGAEAAVGELACEFLRGLNGDDCRLPRNVTNVARQGVTITLPAISESFKNGLTGLRLADMFIMTWNPGKLRARARTFSIDTKPARRTGT